MDTLTVKGPGGVLVPSPPITMIPVRYHLYWAGSDKDGAIAGFYLAVVETTAVPIPGLGIPPLPGPKPTDYHYTTKTDSTFIFTVDELITDRLHAFYIYSVDDQGKPDPTPAKFTFNAIDRFPPQPVIDEAYAIGDTAVLDEYGNPTLHAGRWEITKPMQIGRPPKEHVPAYSELHFRWHGEIAIPNSFITGYRYKLDEPAFNSVDSTVRSASYGTGVAGSPPVTPGQKLFTLRAIDQAKGAGETNRNFMMNFTPDTWWAGPDPAAFPPCSDREYRSRCVDVVHWPGDNDGNEPKLTLGTNPDGSQQVFPSGPFGGTFAFGGNAGEPDSLDYRPSMRYPPDYLEKGGDLSSCMRTFYEFYMGRDRKGRIYARSEGDTVHMNSWVILWNGGYDKDSEYRVRADTTDPVIASQPGKPTLTGLAIEKAGKVGSPIGFRSVIVTRVTPSGMKSSPAQSALYPIYEPASVFRSPRVGGYWRMMRAGKAYALARAEDADGGIDNDVDDAANLADNSGSDSDPLRRKVLFFYVDKAPTLLRDSPSFLPARTPSDTVSLPDPPGSCNWTFRLFGDDLDPVNPAEEIQPGKATLGLVGRFKITLYGKSLGGVDTSWTYIHTNGSEYITEGGLAPPQFTFRPGGDTGNPFASGPMDVSIEVCDCHDCEEVPGQGRCVQGIDPDRVQSGFPWGHPVLNPQNVIHVNYTRPAACP